LSVSYLLVKKTYSKAHHLERSIIHVHSTNSAAQDKDLMLITLLYSPLPAGLLNSDLYTVGQTYFHIIGSFGKGSADFDY